MAAYWTRNPFKREMDLFDRPIIFDMNISLRQLRAFVAVAQSSSFSRAADALALTQPAVSRNVTDLEQAMGLLLLHRTTREVELTEAGRLLLGNLSRVLEDLDACLLEVQGLATQRKAGSRWPAVPRFPPT